MAFSRTLKIAFERVTTIKEFTDVSPDIMLYDKFAARMLEHEVSYIKHHVIKKNILESLFEHLFLELFSLHDRISHLEFNHLAEENLVENLADCHETKETADVDNGQSELLCVHVLV